MQDKQTIHKTELVKQAAALSDISTAAAARLIDNLLDTVKTHLRNGFKVSITDFGTFEAQSKPERSGRNPQTGEAITIAAHMAVKFKAGKALKDAVNA
ncbi:TPA: HU family DNA-binding protein [Neisseria bacilliformis]|jgi:histone family protein DNA-binding protein|uniref:HU family DNA-binding protein n=2 Tax=root TaxID=1 RepID=F2BEX8_9NEIS|nr:HU family DNA-binding protein [Neisseria bacilliformis]EGF09657.1 HU family DNA-binding protein [Neisseria bacilliformis ATCC BAA-1200]QMT46926.1 HU family DNA-binding protein [Neisseria bacilliformis]DAD96054.1 MAG TPA: DNA binding protein [Myoviridae sp. ctpjm1]DAY45981.1 MAG TPA: DNA binding protein [Caudoviricetes sp.]